MSARRIERARGERDAAVARLQQAIAAMDVLVAAHADVAVFREDLIDADEAIGDTLGAAVDDVGSARARYRRAIELIDASASDGALAPDFVERRGLFAGKITGHG